MPIFLSLIWVLVATGLVQGAFPQKLIPREISNFATGRACPTKELAYEDRRDSVIPNSISAVQECRTLQNERVEIGERVRPPDYDKYPEAAAARAGAYMSSQNRDRSGFATTGDMRLKQFAVEEASNAAYERAKEEWGNKPKLPILTKIELKAAPTGFLFIQEQGITTEDKPEYYSPTWGQHLALTILFQWAPIAGFIWWRSRRPAVANPAPAMTSSTNGRTKQDDLSNLTLPQARKLLRTVDPDTLKRLKSFVEAGPSVDVEKLMFSELKECRSFQRRLATYFRAISQAPVAHLVRIDDAVRNDDGDIMYRTMSMSPESYSALKSAFVSSITR